MTLQAIANFEDPTDPDRWVNPFEPPDVDEPPFEHDKHEPPFEENPYVERLRSGIITTAEMEAMPPPAPLVAGYLNLDSLAEIYGPSGVGKSFLALDVANHVARAAWWQGREVTGGSVLYVAAEGVAGYTVRLPAWRKHNNMSAEVHPIHWYPSPINLANRQWIEAMAEVAADLGVSLIVLDTLARNIVGVDENSTKDMGQVVEHLDTIRRATGACVLLVHHTGKDAGRGARGASALKGALDTELEVTGDAERLTLKITKQKDGPELAPLQLALVNVPDTDSCAIGRPKPPSPHELPAGAAATLEALRQVDVPGGISSTAWQAATDANERTYYRHRSGLIEQGLVVNVGTDKTPRYRPADRVEVVG